MAKRKGTEELEKTRQLAETGLGREMLLLLRHNEIIVRDVKGLEWRFERETYEFLPLFYRMQPFRMRNANDNARAEDWPANEPESA